MSKIAHINRDYDPARIQTLDEHAHGVASLAAQFASEFHMSDWGHTIGLLHDKGKERNSFQAYMRTIAGMDDSWHGEDKTHAFIGAAYVNKMNKSIGLLLGYPIMGHHSGLDDYCNFEKKASQPIPPEINMEGSATRLSIPKELLAAITDPQTLGRSMHHIVRMLFSCLVDADFLDTERFMDSEHNRLRQQKPTLHELLSKLRKYLDNIASNAAPTPLNTLRQQIQNRCAEMADSQPGIYSLTVPTGGGKTLSSLVWAIKHAIKHGKHRIIIAIPYTSIVTQTAEILSGIFGRENVLEHHSNNDISQIRDEALRMRMKLASENWDYPIIVTTNVQLFESAMSNKPASCRKLHNICNSVLILDEVQTLPLEHLQPIIDSLQAFQQLFGASILFTTASLPALRGDICWGRGATCQLRGIRDITEIIPEEWCLHDKLRRTRLIIDRKPIDTASLATALARHEKVLCIVNTRNTAREVFEALPADGYNLHLSRMMCSAHLRKTTNTIKQALKDNAQPTLRVIATPLVEAGVDIDFPAVYRQESGLDSVLQAAGRCNREGKSDMGDVHVFALGKKPFGSIGRASDSMQSLEGQQPDWYAPATMLDYFLQRYSRNDNFDKANINEILYKPTELQFETAAHDFRMIDDGGAVTVYVNYEDSASLIDEIRHGKLNYHLVKRLSQYAVNLRQADFETMAKSGLIDEVIEGIYYIGDKQQYRDDVGLVTSSHWLEETLTI